MLSKHIYEEFDPCLLGTRVDISFVLILFTKLVWSVFLEMYIVLALNFSLIFSGFLDDGHR